MYRARSDMTSAQCSMEHLLPASSREVRHRSVSLAMNQVSCQALLSFVHFLDSHKQEIKLSFINNFPEDCRSYIRHSNDYLIPHATTLVHSEAGRKAGARRDVVWHREAHSGGTSTLNFFALISHTFICQVFSIRMITHRSIYFYSRIW